MNHNSAEARFINIFEVLMARQSICKFGLEKRRLRSEEEYIIRNKGHRYLNKQGK